ncbi:hypothetical protein [Cerasicoccus frondis]|uniref:hypothetical protein n=1 Tax=Cerasicoccus frondis TaxID=490090 RepID=UPI0028529D46|nr:hypothetical protein [Cerasicoccus frondis]
MPLLVAHLGHAFLLVDTSHVDSDFLTPQARLFYHATDAPIEPLSAYTFNQAPKGESLLFPPALASDRWLVMQDDLKVLCMDYMHGAGHHRLTVRKSLGYHMERGLPMGYDSLSPLEIILVEDSNFGTVLVSSVPYRWPIGR